MTTASQEPRHIPSPRDIVRVTRTLVYEGPREWVEDCLEKRSVKGDNMRGIISPPRSLVELTVTNPPELIEAYHG